VQTAEEQLILSIDTATQTRSVAVVRGARVLALGVGEGANTHSANVLVEIDEVLRRAGVKIKEIELFAAAAGPGSFTGVRAGLATLKAFAATLARPVVGVPTLHAVARAAGEARRVWALIPAGRGEVFAQLLSVAKEGRVTELSEATHTPPLALLDAAVAFERSGLKWAGEGAHVHAQLIRERAAQERLSWAEVTAESDNEVITVENGWTLAKPSKALAEHVAALALEASRAGLPTQAEDLRAIYVRPSDAELNEKTTNSRGS
jgi:tRNA threonylcarbamoyladenosine biosynthesis protein TsaB